MNQMKRNAKPSRLATGIWVFVDQIVLHAVADGANGTDPSAGGRGAGKVTPAQFQPR